MNVAGDGGATDLRPGGHPVLTIEAQFSYDSADEDIKGFVIDTPAGGVGNPNAIPWEQRCLEETFNTGTCPASSQIGTVELGIIGGTPPLTFPLTLSGTLSLIQTDPEIPARVGVRVESPAGPVRSFAQFGPWTEGDFRVRQVTLGEFPRDVDGLPIQIVRFKEVLFSHSQAGVAQITNPVRCDDWYTYVHAQAYDDNSNANSDPFGTGAPTHRVEGKPTTPDCSTLPPFNVNASLAIDNNARGAKPTLTTTIEQPGIYDGDQSTARPVSVVATLPKSMNVDLQQLLRVCEAADLAANACPPHTKVGTATITTPLIKAGLTGDVHLARSTTAFLPDLVIFVRGVINFKIVGTNRYVNQNQLQSTFTNLPQPGFEKFTMTLPGGPDGLLQVYTCPRGAAAPEDGPMTMQLTSGLGQVVNVSQDFAFPECTGVQLKRVRRCVKSKLRISPAYAARSNISKAELFIGKKRVKTSTRSPFRFLVNVKNNKKYKPGKKYAVRVKVTYKSGKVITKKQSFRKCPKKRAR